MKAVMSSGKVNRWAFVAGCWFAIHVAAIAQDAKPTEKKPVAQATTTDKKATDKKATDKKTADKKATAKKSAPEKKEAPRLNPTVADYATPKIPRVRFLISGEPNPKHPLPWSS